MGHNAEAGKTPRAVFTLRGSIGGMKIRVNGTAMGGRFRRKLVACVHLKLQLESSVGL